MAKNNPTADLRFVRLKNTSTGFKGHAITAPIYGMQDHGVGMGVTLISGLAQGCIVSISRGSPPPKKR